jgi:hypothetical protein
MSDISSLALSTPLINGAKLSVEVTPFDPDVCLRTELDIIIFVLITSLLRA